MASFYAQKGKCLPLLHKYLDNPMTTLRTAPTDAKNPSPKLSTCWAANVKKHTCALYARGNNPKGLVSTTLGAQSTQACSLLLGAAPRLHISISSGKLDFSGHPRSGQLAVSKMSAYISIRITQSVHTGAGAHSPPRMRKA